MKFVMKNCNISIGETTILSNVNINLGKNDFLRIKGDNGSGKTVLLNSLLGLNPRGIEGDYTLIYNKNEICYITEKPFFFDNESVKNVLKTIMQLYSLKDSEIKQILNYLNLDIKNLQKKKINELSKGTRKKLHIIPMFAKSNKILILDEIFTGLDLETQNIIIDFITERYLEGILILMVEHNISIVDKLKKNNRMEEIECKNGKVIH